MSSKEEYLKRYLGGPSAAANGSDFQEPLKKKKKKKKDPLAPAVKTKQVTALRMVDRDVTLKTLAADRETVEDDDDEDAPVMVESDSVRRLREREEKMKNYYEKASDGSGWETVPEPVPSVDLSPPRRKSARHDSPEDNSPPRRKAARHDSPDGDLSPPRRKPAGRHDSPDGDLSPPRRKPAGRHDSPDGDMSPPRRKPAGRHDSPDGDLSPPRRKPAGRHDSPDGDLSPPRRAGQPASLDKSARDRSPPRKTESSKGKSGTPQEDDGTQQATGLIKAVDLTSELAKKRRAEEARFNALSLAESGRGAETQFRDKTGKKVSREELKRQQKEERDKRERIKPEWGGGLAQKREAEAKAKQLQEESSKPFARYKDDKEVDAVYKQKHVSRWGDPMAHLVKNKQNFDLPPAVPEGFKVEGSGFKIPSEVPEHSWLRRNLGAAANRYGIKPGRHWDGVDRSTGFEINLFKTMSEKSSRANAAYKWSVEDM